MHEDEQENLPEPFGDVVMSRAEIAYQMKLQGLSLTDIAQELNVEPKAVSDMIKRRFAFEASYLTDEERQGILSLEMARLDTYLRKLWPSIEHGDPKAIATALKITEVRIKACQLDQASSTATTQILVVGGESASYVDKLKELTDGE